MESTEKSVSWRSPKQFVALVILVLMAMVTSFVEVSFMPDAEWLKYDPSGIIVILAGFIYSPWIGMIVAVLAWIPHLVTNPLGSFMNIMASVSMVIVVGLVYHKKPSIKRAVLGVASGIIAATLVSVCLNFVVTPLYLPASYEDVAALVASSLLPFNLIKAAINGSIALVAYRRLQMLLSEGP